MVVLIMRHLAGEIAKSHMMPCQKRAHFLGEVFRLDAKAEEDEDTKLNPTYDEVRDFLGNKERSQVF